MIIVSENWKNVYKNLEKLAHAMCKENNTYTYKHFARACNWFEKKFGYQIIDYSNKNVTMTASDKLGNDLEHYAMVDGVITREIAKRENKKLDKTIEHFGEMSLIEFRNKIEELTERKVCVNGGKGYLHIYNILYKNCKKTKYRCHNYYISIGSNYSRTIENAQIIAEKCLKFAEIENYGQNEVVPVEKF